MFVVRPEHLSVFGPASGLLLGYLLVTGRRHWGGAALAAFAGNLCANLAWGHAPGVSAGFAVVSAGEPLLTAWALERLRRGPLRLDATRDVLWLFAGPLVVCAATALVGAGVTVLGPGAPSYWSVWTVWWLVDAFGAILFAALVLAWCAPDARWDWTRPRVFESGALVALVALVDWVIFVSDLPARGGVPALRYPVFPLLLWVTLRSDLRGTSVAVVITALIATWGALTNLAPAGLSGASAADRIIVTQGFTACVCLTSLVLGTALRERRAAEAELRGQKNVLRAVLDSMGDGVLVADATGRVLLTNVAFERLYGATAGARTAAPADWSWAHGLYRPDGTTPYPREHLPLSRALRGEACDDVRLVVVTGAHPDGVCVSVTGRPMVGATGRTEGGVVAIRDVTPAVRAEAALRESEQRFRAIFHAQFQFIGLMAPDGTLLEANRAALTSAGASEGDFLGEPFWETKWWTHDPAQQERLRAAVARAAAGQQDRFEASHPTPSGELVWVDFSLTPFRDETGAVVLLIPEGRDITDRKRMEDELVATRDRMRLLLESTGEGIYGIDSDGRCTFVNRAAAAALGYEPAAVIGRNMHELLHHSRPDGSPYPVSECPIFRAFRSGACCRVADEVFWHRDGRAVPVEYSSFPLIERGAPVGAVVAFRDSTDRRRGEEELREAAAFNRSVLDALSAHIAVVDRTGAVTAINRAWERFAEDNPTAEGGVVRAGIGTSYLDACDRGAERGCADAQVAGSGIREVLAGGGPWSGLEYECHGPAGPQWFSMSVTPLGTARGGAVISHTNVTARKRAEEAVRESEERFRSAFEFAAIGMALVAPGGRWLQVNRALCDLLGYSEPELLRSDFQAVTHPGDLDADLTFLKQTLDGTIRAYQMEKRYLHKGGHIVPVLLSVSLVRDAAGHPLYFISQIQDVSKRKEAERALRVSEERFRLIIGGVTDHAIFMLDPTGHVASWNAGAERIKGFTADEILGRHFSAFYPPDRVAAGHPRSELAAAAEAGHYSEEGERVRKDGSRFWAAVTVSTLRDDSGRHLGFVKVVQDVTERRRAEEALRASEERYRSVVESLAEGVVLQNAAGTIIAANERAGEILGLTRDQITGRSSLDPAWGAVREDGAPFPGTEHPAMVALRTGRPVFNVVMGVRKPAGGQSWMTINAVPIRRTGTRDDGAVVASFHDITEARQLHQRVRASLREKEVLLKEIHHRVKNNLQIVSTLLDLQSEHTRDARALEMFRESRERVKSMAIIHERLYRSEDLARVNFGDYVRQLAFSLYRTYKTSDADVRLEVDASAPPLTIDVAMPCGLLLNELLSNCLKHAFVGTGRGTIRVTLFQTGDGTNVLSVGDDGAGLPPGINVRNTGSFGLQLVNTLAEQLGSTLEVNTDRGTVFTVRFTKQ
ncbi:Two-component system sensor histidine kinase [Frigoriglobus tundricola]|uniref:Two-component system sensor histidine kinase n=1 Tax=Frigoriglobus tundricola TaxID=2774151 RepID=A0A6M5YT00_9BACT|nr:Two-component system sensor histidine kinase [Frigoriglobus tundricola]